MRLLRLLTAGKSLVGLQDCAGRYHVADQRLLPKFGSTKNPFRASTLPSVAAEVRDPVENLPAGQGPGAEPLRPASSAPSHDQACGRSLQAVPGQPQAPQPRGDAADSQPTGRTWFGQCASKLATLLAPAPKPPKPVLPRLAKSPVQGELSLDRIKVVRNDLSDSDLEVVPAKVPNASPVVSPVRSPQPSEAAAKETQENAEPVGAAWSRVSSRLFGAGKTLT